MTDNIEKGLRDQREKRPLAAVVGRLRSQLLLAATAFGLVFAAVANQPFAWTVPGVFVVFGILDTIVVLRGLSRSRVPNGADGDAVIKSEAKAGRDVKARGRRRAWIGRRATAERDVSAEAGSWPRHWADEEEAAAEPQLSPPLPAQRNVLTPAGSVPSGVPVRRRTNRFVGREAQLAEATALLDTRGASVLLDVSGVHGVGKSTFLVRLVEEAELKGMRIYQRDLVEDGIGDGYVGDGPDVSLDVLHATLTVTSRLIQEIASHFDDPGLRSVLAVYEAEVGAGRPFATVDVGRGAKAGRDIIATATVNVTGEAARQATIERRERLADLFVTAWSQFTAGGTALLVFDSFEQVADDPIGRWLGKLFLRLPDTVIAVSRLSTQREVSKSTARVRSLEQLNFSRDETRRYLDLLAEDRDLGASASNGELADLVYSYTYGHPTGVELVAKFAFGSVGPGGTPDLAALRRELGALEGTLSERIAALVELILRPIANPLVREVVTAASVTPRFTRAMVASLIETDEWDEMFVDAMRQLETLHLLRVGVGPQSNDKWRRLPTYIRDAIAGQLQNSPKWQGLNEAAAKYCFEQLSEITDFDTNTDTGTDTNTTDGLSAGAYGSWYKYEKAEWQYYEQAWLYYTARTEKNAQLTRARMTEVFLDAFWWWGCYYPFPFNRHLIEDWDQYVGQLTDVKDRMAGQDLRDVMIRFLEAYPLGHVKTDASWEEIMDDLLLLDELCGARADGARPAGTERVGALINIFLAHTRRFHDPHDPEGIAYYEAAMAGFEEIDDKWVTAWLLEERADFALERGLPDEALAFVDRSATVAVDLAEEDGEWDHELLANLHRITADVHWAAGDTDAAAGFYATALLEAYWLQGAPHPPDGYTALFYTEIAGRITERVRDLAERSGSEEALRFAEAATPVPLKMAGRTGTADFAEALATPQRPELLPAALFPPPPALAEGEDPAFNRLWRRRSRQMTPSAQTCGRLFIAEEREHVGN